MDFLGNVLILTLAKMPSGNTLDMFKTKLTWF